ncbi:MAG: tetratricopeptide repeat protein [Bacteroidales bacterium]|nr:tetratricopeptide repeat protein [Bacteroidales bacterium]MDD4216944.1 tetratricopeptide repeat protein [Bacteroidales bacterium]MDY0140733.1 tetratricopeptide repeat protein [Bacteroidales bacterium]
MRVKYKLKEKSMLFKLRLYAVLVLMFSGLFVSAQQTGKYSEPNFTFLTALELYEKGMYVPAQKKFSEILMHKGTEHSSYKDDAAYYIALCSMHLFNYDAEYQLQSFIEGHPESYNNNNASFQMANYHFRNRKFKDAIEWYDNTERMSLTAEEQSEFFFKLGFSHFARNDFDRAAKAFYESKDDANIYGPMSLYFYSHIKYISEQYQTALIGFIELEKQPAFASIAPFYVSQIYFLQEKYDELIKYAPNLLDSVTGARAAEISKLLGTAYYRTGKYAEAIPHLNTYMQNTSSKSDFDYYEIGFAYYNTKQYQNASNAFTRIVNMKDTLSQYAAYHLGDCYLKMGDLVQARNSFETASLYKFNPAIREDALFNFAQLCFELSLSPFNEAINAFSQYIKEYPKSLRVDKAYDYLLDAFLNTKNYLGAIQTIEKIPTRTPKIDAAYQRLAYFRGLENFTELKYNEAIVMFDKSLEYKIYDKNITALSYYWKAEANMRLGNDDDAIAQFKEFVNSTGSVSLEEYGKAHYNLGYAYFNKKQYALANTWFRKFEMQSGFENTALMNDALNRIGDCYYIEKEFGPAAIYYKKAADISVIGADYTLYQMALSFGGQKDYKKKIWSLRRLVNDYPESEYIGNAHFEIGRTYQTSMNSPDSAKFYFNRFISNYPNSSMKKAAMSSLGSIYFNQRDYNDALNIYKGVIAEFPNTEEASNANVMIREIYIEMDNPDEYIEYASSGAVDISQDEQDEIMWLAAKKLYIDQKYNDALSSLTNYLKKFPTGKFSIEANYFKAELHFYFEEKTPALICYRVVADASRGAYTEESTIKAASILFDNENWDQAFDYYQKLYPLAENKSTKLIAAIGRLRCAYNIGKWDEVIAAASDLINNEKSNEEQRREAYYKMAKSYYAKDNLIRAIPLFTNLSTEVISFEGAEAKFRIAEINFQLNNDSIAEYIVYEFAQMNSPQAYWLAKSFILLSDIYYKREEYYSAKQTLQTVLTNYKNEIDGIKDEASEKLSKILDEEQAIKGEEDLLKLKINLVEEDSKDSKLFEDDNNIIRLPKPAEIKENADVNEQNDEKNINE